jgi:predicted O-linked N-acetylglucosamine transferase (SPINDLY family)
VPDTQTAITTAVSLAQSGRIADAIATISKAIAADQSSPAAYGLLGTLYHSTGRTPEAIRALQRAHDLAPTDARIAYQLGAILATAGDPRRGVALMTRAIDLDPSWTQAAVGLAAILSTAGDLAGADAVYRRSLANNPASAELLCGLGGLLVTAGRPQQAAGHFRAAGRAHPESAEVLGKLLSALNYADDASREEVFDAHQRWGRAVMRTAEPPPAWPNTRDPERRLRIGFLSPDLYDHSCAYFLRPILRHRPRGAVEVFCYSTSARSDWMTGQLQLLSDHWRPAAGAPEPALLKTLRDDRLDILVELSGHTAMGPLAALGHRAAPVQMTYLGYPNTTGLPTIDYRITDALTDTGGAEAFHTERLVRLPGCFLCYSPAEFAPDGAAWQPPPSITFASFNSIRKLSPTTIRLWSAILGRVAGSRLLLKTRGLSSPFTRQNLLDQFASCGIAADRLELSDMVPEKADHLASYRRADIALDTFPYNGTTTTCEALWMGVPVVTLAGDRHAARVGLSLLTAAGLPELVADSPGSYIDLAAALAADPARLAEYHRTLRDRLSTSPLLGGVAFAPRFFDALRAAWREWCAGPGAAT